MRPDAEHQEIRAAYLRLMRDSHPDYRPGDERAADRARAANAAWEVLGDSARRASYDRLRTVRAAHADEGPGRRTEHRADAEVAFVAYSPEKERYRRDLTQALLRIGLGVFAAALVLLITFA